MTAGERLEALERAGAPEPEDPEAEAARLRADIAQTRESIGSTINALQEKLSPAALADQAKSAVREATIGKVETMVENAESTLAETGYSVTHTIRRHPLAAALAGIGLAWLWMQRRRDMKEYKEYRYRDEGREALSGTMRRKAGDVVHRVEDMAERAQESIGEATSDAGERVKSLAREAKERTVRAEHRVEDVYFERPLAVGAVALAAGTALGLAIPITRREERWMGEARDQVVEKVTEMAQHAMGQVQEATAGGQ